MEHIANPARLQDLCWGWRQQGQLMALVPTMGYFHAGHLELMRWARANADKVVVSLFVNPTQFAPTEDLAAYPRDLERDAALAAEQGVDVLFVPPVEKMYLPGDATWVEVPELAQYLCGRSRPTHFRGVTTVVAKLLLLAIPTLAVFGEKDYQQLTIIRRMTRDLFIPTRIVGRPIVREADGLAMSSRNVYLSPEERVQAPRMQQGLQLAAAELRKGQRDTAALAQLVREFYAREIPLGETDYLEFADPDTLHPVSVVSGPVLAAVAVRFGKARLIDNLLIETGSAG